MLVKKYNIHQNIKKENQDTSYADLEKYFMTPTQTEFVNMAGHEMKTTIQAILTYSELLQNKHDESREDYVKAILRNALRLKMLTNNLSDLTKIDANILKLKKETFNLRTLVLSLVEDFRNMSRCHELKISITVQSPEDIFVNADAERLSQVILNLLDNATKFTREGDITITLEERQGENCIFLSMTDTGIGIDQSIAPNLFSKFVTSSNNGTGLGLYICRNIIEAHEGQIWVKNNRDKNGATFSFKIPINNTDSNTRYTKFLNSRIGV
ncbi:Signal transduction histidine kinase, with phosphoacceptor and ATP binding domain (fragment) [Nitrosotalea devaniterrae]|uniref:histidine kinase n=1 Tax=Nitrosotalea devaniterrae TaxID=1078905 RepID=A0A128A4I2_9ARCH